MTFTEWWEEIGDDLAFYEGDDPRAMALHGWEAAQPEWRPIEIVPKNGTRVLLSTNNGYVVIGSYNTSGDWPDGLFVAWMPQPQPLEGEP